MKLRHLILFFAGLNTSLFAQKKITPEKAITDLTIFENILRQGHPGLYDYISEIEIAALFSETKRTIQDTITDLELYKKMLSITDKVNDGHLLLFPPKHFSNHQLHFPLLIKIIDKQLYTDTGEFDIPVGSRIHRIHDNSDIEIITRLKKYIPNDGINTTKIMKGIEQNFGQLLSYEFGFKKEFVIEYSPPSEKEKKTAIISADKLATIKHRAFKRNSNFAAFHQEEKAAYSLKYIQNKLPVIRYKKEYHAAILTINSFQIDPNKFELDISNIFKEIKKNKVQHLIIDIRRNDGGMRKNAITLYSYLTQTYFKQRINDYITSLSIPEKKYVQKVFLPEKEFLTDKFINHPVYSGWKLNFDNMETMMVPQQHPFSGKVYVLTSGNTFATAASFALLAKNDKKIITIGEETGGAYYHHNGEYPVSYQFPNSSIRMVLYMIKTNHYVRDTTIPKGSGIPPDRYIKTTLRHILDETDPELDYIYRLISPKAP